jgi:hypothetical protein
MPAQTHVTAVLAAKPPAHAPMVRRLLRQPLLLTGLAAVPLVAGLLMVAPPLVPLSPQALVIAPVTAVSTPIQGLFEAASLSLGARVERGDQLGTVRNDHVDTSTLKGLGTRRDSTRVKRHETVQQIADEERSVVLLTSQVEQYRAGLAKDLERRLDEERSELAKRNAALGLIAEQAALPGARAAVDSQQKLIDDLGRRLASLRAGQFEADDLPVAQRRIDEATSRIASLGQQQRALDGTLAELDGAIAAEEAKVAALRLANIAAPVAGILWSRQAGDRQPLDQGKELLRIADPGAIEVEALLHERHRDNMATDVVIEVISDSGRRVRGTMIGDLKPATHSKPAMTASLSSAAPGYDKLYIRLDPTAAPLPIGEKVKIIVLGHNPGIVRRTLAWFYELTRF